MADGGGGGAKGSAVVFALRKLVGCADFGYFHPGEQLAPSANFRSVRIIFGPQRVQMSANRAGVVWAMEVLFVQD